MIGNRVKRLVLGLGFTAIGLGVGPVRGDVLYGISEASSNALATYDPATGHMLSSIPVTGTANGFRDIVSDHNNQLLVASWGFNQGSIGGDRTLFRLNPSTGATTEIGAITDGVNTGFWVEGMAWVNGTLYASADPVNLTTGQYEGYTADGAIDLIKIDPATGHATMIGAFGSNFLNMQNIAYSPQYGLIGSDIGTLNPDPTQPNGMYSTFNTTPALVKIDPKTGVATLIAGLPFDRNTLVTNPFNPFKSPEATYVSGLDFTPDGSTLYGATIQTHFGGTASGLVTIDPLTGAVTTIGTLNQPSVLGITFASVPEPSAIVLVGLGLLGVGAWRWRVS
jgi:hypothetical protein